MDFHHETRKATIRYLLGKTWDFSVVNLLAPGRETSTIVVIEKLPETPHKEEA